MAASGYELFDSRGTTVSPQSPQTEFHYRVYGTIDPSEVTDWVVANAPLIYGTLQLQDAKLNNLGGGEWYVVTTYGDPKRDGLGKPDGSGAPLDAQGQPSQPPSQPTRPQPTDNLGPEFSFEINTETAHISQSEGVVSAISADPTLDPPDTKGAIGLTKDGVAGVDIAFGVLTISETRKMESITTEYLDTLTEMAGTVCNTHGFWRWKQREVYFDGASGQGHDNYEWTVTFRFKIRRWRDNVVISPDITIPRVFGHDYIDVIYSNQVDEDVLLRTPAFVYVHQIYRESDFSKLGIGK